MIKKYNDQNQPVIDNFFIRGIFHPSGMIKELQRDERKLIQELESEKIIQDSKKLISEDKLLCYLTLKKETLKELQDSRKTTETKAQSMIGYITFSVSLVTLFIGNANSLLEHGIGGFVGKAFIVLFLALPIVMMIFSGLFAKNVVVTDFYYRSPTYNADEIKNSYKIAFYQQQIKDLSMSIESHNTFNNFKVTSLKYSHLCFQWALYSFFAFFITTLTIFWYGGTPKSKESNELISLKSEISKLNLEIKNFKEKITIEKYSMTKKINDLEFKLKKLEIPPQMSDGKKSLNQVK